MDGPKISVEFPVEVEHSMPDSSGEVGDADDEVVHELLRDFDELTLLRHVDELGLNHVLPQGLHILLVEDDLTEVQLLYHGVVAQGSSHPVLVSRNGLGRHVQVDGVEGRDPVLVYAEDEQTGHEQQNPVVGVRLGKGGVSEALGLLGVVNDVGVDHHL